MTSRWKLSSKQGWILPNRYSKMTEDQERANSVFTTERELIVYLPQIIMLNLGIWSGYIGK